MKILKALFKTLLREVAEDPRFNDPDFDPLKDLLKDKPSTIPDPDVRRRAVERIMEAACTGVWEVKEIHCMKHWFNADTGIYFWTDFEYPGRRLNFKGQRLQLLSEKEEKEFTAIWNARQVRDQAAAVERLAAEQANSILGQS